MEGGSPNTVTRSKWQTVKVLVQEPGDLNSNPNFVIKNILKNIVLYIYIYTHIYINIVIYILYI